MSWVWILEVVQGKVVSLPWSILVAGGFFSFLWLLLACPCLEAAKAVEHVRAKHC